MELCLSGLFFLVRDAEGNPSCTAQGIIMITVMVMTALFHCAVGRGYKLRWRALSSICDRNTEKTSTMPPAKHRPLSSATVPGDLDRDDILTSRPSVLWVPGDRLGVSDDEIYEPMRTKGLWISNKGAYLKGDRVKVSGSPP